MKDQNNRVYYDKLTFIYITLPSFTKTEAELVTHQDKWIYAFKHLATFDEIPKALQESIFLDFFETARVAKLDDEEYGVYQESVKAHRDWFSIYQTYEHNLSEAKKAAELSRQEGIEEGIELGKQEGIELGKQERDIEIAKAMLAQGLAVPVIASITGLTVEQIEGLR
jgi:predicted transposase/invertase (TIGR01784 family)